MAIISIINRSAVTDCYHEQQSETKQFQFFFFLRKYQVLVIYIGVSPTFRQLLNLHTISFYSIQKPFVLKIEHLPRDPDRMPPRSIL